MPPWGQIRIAAEWNGTRKSAFWVRLQDDEDRPISVGFADPQACRFGDLRRPVPTEPPRWVRRAAKAYPSRRAEAGSVASTTRKMRASHCRVSSSFLKLRLASDRLRWLPIGRVINIVKVRVQNDGSTASAARLRPQREVSTARAA